MHKIASLTILAEAGPAPAPTGPAPAWTSMVPLVLMVVVFYFLLIRPQQKKARDHAELLKTVKPGDKIITSGGVVGIVVSVREKQVTIRSADTKLDITKSAIAEITERGGQSSDT
jgi:preprotein translocase subunit YajC